MRNLRAGLAIIAGTGLLGLFCCGEPAAPARLVLNDYPRLFARDVLIIVGANAAPLEQEGAALVAEKLDELTDTKPLVVADSEVMSGGKLTSGKLDGNLIVVGTHRSSRVLQEVYKLTEAVKVTDSYPGGGRGLVEVLGNPWNHDKALLIAAGSDERGVKAASTLLTQEEMVEELSGEIMVTGSLTRLTGQIRIIGSEPFAQPAIETENCLYGLSGGKAARGGELWNLQQAMVEVEGFVEGSGPPSYRTEISIRVTGFRKIQ